MDRWLNVFLKNYAPDEKETFLRARFSTIAILCILLTTSATIIYTTFLYGPFSTLVLMEMCGLLVMLVALGILVKGNYFIAVHTIFITGFATLWLVMFIWNGS